MKKLTILAFALCMFGQVKAEDNVQFVPVSTNAGTSNVNVDIILNRDAYSDVSQLQFEVVMPAGFTLTNKPANVKTGIVPNEQEWDDDLNDGEGGYKTVYTHTPTCVNKGGSLYQVTLSTSLFGVKFKDGNGTALRLRCNVAAGVEAGYYPVRLQEVFLSGTDGVSHMLAETCGYIKVGNPTGKDLTLTDQIPSSVNTALAAEAGITTLNLEGVKSSEGTFTYVDGREVVAPTADFAATAAYSKTVSKYASLTMPFAADLTGKGAYVLGSVTGNTANFVDATNVNAGDVVLLTKDVALEGTKLGAATKSVQSDVFYVSPDGTELHKGTNVTIPALRGYWSIPSASNLRIALDGVLTDINMVDVQGEGAQVFDLQGRQVQNAKNGVYVVNGKKQFVK